LTPIYSGTAQVRERAAVAAFRKFLSSVIKQQLVVMPNGHGQL
jgi:hypothetical protein